MLIHTAVVTLRMDATIPLIKAEEYLNVSSELLHVACTFSLNDPKNIQSRNI